MPPRPQPDALNVLFEDNHLLIVNKQAELPTMGVSEGKASVLSVAKDYVRRKYNKPGNVYLGIVSRLDAPVTGALLIARTSKAASRLSQQFRERKVEKTYLAIVEGVPDDEEATLQHFLRRDERHRRMHTTMKDQASAQLARLRYRLVGVLGDQRALLEVHLETGRKHQIRVQLSAIGHPILGDRKYKSTQAFGPGVALHSYRLCFRHPVKDERVEVGASVPDRWHSCLPSRALSEWLK